MITSADMDRSARYVRSKAPFIMRALPLSFWLMIVQLAWAIFQALINRNEGASPGLVMRSQYSELSDADLRDIAERFGP